MCPLFGGSMDSTKYKIKEAIHFYTLLLSPFVATKKCQQEVRTNQLYLVPRRNELNDFPLGSLHINE